MRISKPLAVFVAVATIWPLFYMVLFFASAFGSVSASGGADVMPIFGTFENMMVLHLATMAVMLLLMIFYIVHAFKNPALASDKRLLWVIVLFFGSLIAGIIYWFHYVWRQPPALPDQPQGAA